MQVRLAEETIKESLAEERTACQERLDRRAVRDRLEAASRHQHRDHMLRLEISGWLQVKSVCNKHARHSGPHWRSTLES